VDITFLSGTTEPPGPRTLCDCDFGGERVVLRKSVVMPSFWCSNWPWWDPSGLELVNCRFKDLSAATHMASAVPKYYLDVQVLDGEGRPVAGAEVTVVNEQYTGNEPVASAVTGENGHTPLPSTESPALVLADYHLTQAARREFTYTIAANAPDGSRGVVRGVDPGPGWYRSDAHKPTKTVRVALAGA
jgi:5-hydroxyisourate hydrolase-like protein (transthyretin family)